MTELIIRRALRVEQSNDHSLYLFALTASEIGLIADISRVSRNDDGRLIGYQRPEVRKHVDGIVEYLDSDAPLMPNALVLALTGRVAFKRSRGPQGDDDVVVAGTLEIPVPRENGPKPAWIVDGQQRSLALRRASNGRFPVPVAAFVADSVEFQRDQFVRVNNSRPLPTGLVTELLPEISTPISPRLAQRRLPSALVDQLNNNPDSPLKGMIRRPSMSRENKRVAVITDTSLVKGLEEALSSPASCLFPYRNIASGETDVDGIWSILLCYWTAVHEVFPEAWGLPATKSRLMHGVGIRSMCRLMDRVMSNIDPKSDQAVQQAAKELRKIEPRVRWTSGYWEELGGTAWNQLENTPKDIKMLSNYLIRLHFNGGNS